MLAMVCMNHSKLEFPPQELQRRCETVLVDYGASAVTAGVLADAVVQAELRGKPAVGVAHLFDYIDAMRDGRMNGDPHPEIESRRSAVIVGDADLGPAQVAFDLGLPTLLERTHQHGSAVLSLSRCFSAGELAYYSLALAREGFLAVAATNSPALMSVYGSRKPVAGTNPLSFALPHATGGRAFDQASSATAWVRVRDAAASGDPLPSGWAIDEAGHPTTDAGAALGGALLPFGGAKGANIAMMVEALSTLSGGNFSVDAPPFDRGHHSPSLGLFVLAMDPAAFDPGYVERLEAHHLRLRTEHEVDFARRKTLGSSIELNFQTYETLLQYEAKRPARDGVR